MNYTQSILHYKRAVKRMVTYLVPMLIFLIFYAAAFSAASFQHQSTGFPLTGMHAELLCSDCHSQAAVNNYGGQRSECATCHLSEYNSTDHISRIYLITDCSRCHNTSGWNNQQFVHENSDHQCSICHMSDENSANQMVTGHGQLANNCSICHSASAWTSILYEHLHTERANQVPNDADCSACHQNGFMNVGVTNE